MPGETVPQWIDIYSRLYKERIIFLFRIFEDDFINQVISMLLYLNIENKNKSIYLYLNSIGGSISSGLALYDTINYINTTSVVVTMCLGIASSISSFILASGNKKKRLALPHSRIMLHQPETECYGQASEILIESEEILRIRRLLAKIYVENTSQTLSRIARDMDRDCFLSSREAKSYGIIDYIISN